MRGLPLIWPRFFILADVFFNLHSEQGCNIQPNAGFPGQRYGKSENNKKGRSGGKKGRSGGKKGAVVAPIVRANISIFYNFVLN